MRRRVIFLFLFALVFLYPCQAVFALPLTDVRDHWAKGYIEQLSETRAVNGYPDGAFRPEGIMTRAEFIKTLVKLCGLPLKPDVNPTFTDVTVYHWSYPYIETAVAAGIIPEEYVQMAFGPDEPITRVEAAMFLSRSLGAEVEDSTYTGFDDGSQIPQELRGYIRAAKERGLIAGYPDGTFRSWNPMTRAEASAVLVRFIYEQGKGKGLVAVSYDHQLPSVYENAFPVHKAYGYPGVNYVCTASVGEEGNMTFKQLKEMESAGWETASHSANHLHFKELEEKDIRVQLLTSKLGLKQNGLAGENFAYPFWFTVPNPLVQEYYQSGATSYEKEMNTRPINPYRLRRYYLQHMSREEICTVLDKTVAEGGWVIFYTHGVYKGSETPDDMSINQEMLKTLFDSVTERNMQVVTVKQGLQLMAGR